MTALLAFIALLYLLVASVALLAYRHEPIKTRIILALIAPAVLAWTGCVWVMSRLEGLG